MSNAIKDDSDLRDVLARSIRMTLPPTLAGPLASAVESEDLVSLPSPSILSRWRFLLDAAFMLCCREAMLCDPQVRYLQIDSSTQGGKDYELIVLTCISKSSLALAMRKSNLLIANRHAPVLKHNKQKFNRRAGWGWWWKQAGWQWLCGSVGQRERFGCGGSAGWWWAWALWVVVVSN